MLAQVTLTTEQLNQSFSAPMRTKVAQSVIQALQDRNARAGFIQSLMIAHVVSLAQSDKPKLACVRDDTLNQIFSANIRGKDAKQLASWIEAFTPIRINFDKGTGRFTKLGWSDLSVKLAKDNGLALFRIDEMQSNRWTEYDAKQGRAKATPAMERSILALVREMARGIDVGAFTQEDAVGMVQDAMRGIDTRIEEVRRTEGHQSFVATYVEQVAAAKRAGK